jgi:hypothetical protein
MHVEPVWEPQISKLLGLPPSKSRLIGLAVLAGMIIIK